ncbi:hypothetical protein GGQ99_003873 [Aminobacter niigataensis]|uniref:Uncharacterized protein n=1 Tax=Aminobacter niigataensis TaxID=83265 RepID=A0ABR6L5N1_9HYPH|nr:hypothetical protein [Aminobacter niigataensis]MBB4652100.1 hypothetical protein [Aminobacter niigataensis]
MVEFRTFPEILGRDHGAAFRNRNGVERQAFGARRNRQGRNKAAARRHRAETAAPDKPPQPNDGTTAMSSNTGEIDKTSARLRPAGPEKPAARKPATARDALMTCVLVLYPALATVGAIAASLLLTGTSA